MEKQMEILGKLLAGVMAVLAVPVFIVIGIFTLPGIIMAVLPDYNDNTFAAIGVSVIKLALLILQIFIAYVIINKFLFPG